MKVLMKLVLEHMLQEIDEWFHSCTESSSLCSVVSRWTSLLQYFNQNVGIIVVETLFQNDQHHTFIFWPLWWINLPTPKTHIRKFHSWIKISIDRITLNSIFETRFTGRFQILPAEECSGDVWVSVPGDSVWSIVNESGDTNSDPCSDIVTFHTLIHST